MVGVVSEGERAAPVAPRARRAAEGVQPGDGRDAGDVARDAAGVIRVAVYSGCYAKQGAAGETRPKGEGAAGAKRGGARAEKKGEREAAGRPEGGAQGRICGAACLDSKIRMSADSLTFGHLGTPAQMFLPVLVATD